ncbi:MAG: Gfo/Idh/MocA family oxidoreductase [Clostridiales bacterium]|nr:Gfo/Idh/MocA family oxidoreductase [Clostridiales bacterium]
MKTLKAAVIGVGPRGMGMLRTISSVEGLEIAAICDIDTALIEKAKERAAEIGITPEYYVNYKDIIARGDIDCVFVITNWTTHWRICRDFMKAGIWTSTEVNGANAIEECWELVRTYEETGVPCMMLENCNYGRYEMAVLNMVEQGVFGEVVYAECGYCHDLRKETHFERCSYRDENNLRRNGDLYPTHGVGPMAKILKINHGNRFVSLTSMSTKARGVNDYGARHYPDHKNTTANYACGDITTTLIKCAGGEVLMVRHNTASPRPYSRANLVQGTRAIYSEDKGTEGRTGAVHIDDVHEHGQWVQMDDLFDKYEHPMWKDYKASPMDGHGGMDYLVIKAFVDSARDKTEPPIDTYDTAVMMAVTCLSEQSVAMGSMPVPFPDFTCGLWVHRK